MKSALLAKNRLRNSGSTLLLVTIIGTIAVMLAMALTGSLVDIKRHVSNQGQNQIRNALEVSINYAVAKMNKAAEDGQLSTLVFPIIVPASVTGTYDVKIDAEIFTPAISSAFYSPSITISDFRKLKATIDGMSESLEIVARGSNLNSNATPLNFTNPPNLTRPYFPTAALGNTNLDVGPGVKIAFATPTPSYQTNLLSSNGRIVLGNGSSVIGSVNAFGSSVSTDSISGEPNSIVHGDLHATKQTTFETNSNVWHDGLQSTPEVNNISTSAEKTDLSQAPSPEVNENAIVEIDGNNISAKPSSSSGINDLGSVSLQEDQTLTLKPGNYRVNSLMMGTNSSIVIDNSGTGDQQVRLYVDGASSGDTAISIGEKGITQTGSTSPSNFQIYYGGNKSVNVSMSNSFNSFSSLIYAPNANVSVISKNTTSVFSGSLVGNVVSIKNLAELQYTPPSTPSNLNPSFDPAAYPSFSTDNSGKFSIRHFDIISWKEN